MTSDNGDCLGWELPPNCDEFETMLTGQPARLSPLRARALLSYVWRDLSPMERLKYTERQRERGECLFSRCVEFAKKYSAVEPPVSQGYILTAKLEFTDASDSKSRPVLVLWVDGNDAIVAYMTSQVQKYHGMCDVRLARWRESRLRQESVVRVGRLHTLARSRFKSWVGMVQPEDVNRIKSAWNCLHPLE